MSIWQHIQIFFFHIRGTRKYEYVFVQICNMQNVVNLCRLQQNTKRPRFKWCTAHKLDWAVNFPNISKMKNRPKPIPNERGEGHYELINDHSGWNKTNVLSSHLCDCWQVDKVAKVDQEKSFFLAWRLSKINWNSMQNYYGFKNHFIAPKHMTNLNKTCWNL